MSQRSGGPVAGRLSPYRRGGGGASRKLLLFLLVAGLAFGYYFALAAPHAVMPLLVPVAILIGLVIWALPDMKAAPTRLLSRLLIAFLVALPLWPNYLAIALPGMPWITVLRIISGPMILLLLVCISVSPEFRRRTGQSLSASGSVWKMVLAFALMQALSLGPAIGFGGGIGESIEALILAQMNWTAVFLLSAYVFLRPGSASRTVTALLAVAGVLVIVAAQEWRQGAVPWAGHIPGFLKIDDPLVEKVLSGSARAATGIHRVQASYTTSLGFAEFLALMTPFVLHVAVRGRMLWARLAAMAFLPLLFWTILLTDSRLGILGFLLSCLFYLFIHGLLMWRGERRGLVGPAIVIAYPVMFAGFLLSTFFVQRLSRMVWGGGAASYSTQARIDQWNRGLELIAANPLGYGIGRGGITLGYVNQAGVGTIDSYFLLILLEYGVAGFLLFFGLFLVGIWHAGRALLETRVASWETSLLAPLVIALGNWIIIKSVFAQPDNHPLIFAMLGMTSALVWRARQMSLCQSHVPPPESIRRAVPAPAG
jgi:hypothetical protein